MEAMTDVPSNLPSIQEPRYHIKREYNKILANREEKMDHRYNLGTIASEVRLTWLNPEMVPVHLCRHLIQGVTQTGLSPAEMSKVTKHTVRC